MTVPLRRMVLALAELNGGRSSAQRTVAFRTPSTVSRRFGDAEQIMRRYSGVATLPIHFDLAELRGYRYHTGPVFAAYVPGETGFYCQRPGRYDNIARVFSRPALGFNASFAPCWPTGLRPGDLTAGHAPWTDSQPGMHCPRDYSAAATITTGVADTDPGPRLQGAIEILLNHRGRG
ncbi:MAG: ATP phosphoribosyltransferase regulatory subunit [Candidatus Competibacteraceae bacterium]